MNFPRTAASLLLSLSFGLVSFHAQAADKSKEKSKTADSIADECGTARSREA